MRRAGAAVVLVMAGAIACGGSDGPGVGGPTPATPPPTISGTIVGNPGARPVAGAEIVAGGARLAVTSADGRFSFPNGRPTAVSIAAEGYVTRQTRLSGERTNVVIDLISLAPPFSLEFYRQLARDEQDTGRLAALSRWSVSPGVYIFTNRVTDAGADSGEPIPQFLVDLSRTVVPQVVAQVTAGRLGVAHIEAGTDAGVLNGRAGSIVITFRRRLREASAEGPPDCVDSASVVTGDVATVNLCYSTAALECTLISPGVIAHEVGHALGLHHACFPAPRVGAPYTMCRGSASAAAHRCEATFDPVELFHSAILYSRPGGNVDPDQDPAGFAF